MISSQATQQIGQAAQSRTDPSRLVELSDVLRMPDFHQTWGSLSPLEKCQLGVLMSAIQPKVIVETGVWRGGTTRFLSEYLSLNGIPGTIYGFDLSEIIDELLASDPFFESASNVSLMKGTLPHSLSDWLVRKDVTVDLALIDANHSFYAVYSELSVIAPRLSSGGYIFCHDYGNPGTTFDRVMCAVNEFARLHRFTVLPFHSQSDSISDLKCEAAILHRPVQCPLNQRLLSWRKYFAESYPRVAHVWASTREKIGL
jgi:predicted O-methyltransferase YrrM